MLGISCFSTAVEANEPSQYKRRKKDKETQPFVYLYRVKQSRHLHLKRS